MLVLTQTNQPQAAKMFDAYEVSTANDADLTDLISVLASIREEEIAKKRLPETMLVKRTDGELIRMSEIVGVSRFEQNLIRILVDTGKKMSMKSPRHRTLKVKFDYEFARNSLITLINECAPFNMENLNVEFPDLKLI